VIASIIAREPGVMEQLYKHTEYVSHANVVANITGFLNSSADTSPAEVDLCAANKPGCWYSWLMTIIMGFHLCKSTIYDFNREWLQFKFGPKDYYFKDRFNVIDWLRIPITISTAVIYFTKDLTVPEALEVNISNLENIQSDAGSRFQARLSMSVYLACLGLCQHLQPLPGIGPVVVVVVKSIADILVYIAVLALIVFATTIAMFTLVGRTDHEDAYLSFQATLMRVFKLLAIGETVGEVEDHASEAAFTAVFITSVIVGTIVVVNLIVAKLTNTFEASKKISEQTRRKQHAALILIYEEVRAMSATGSWMQKISAFIAGFPYFSIGRDGDYESEDDNTWLHVLVEQGGNTVMWKVPRDHVIENFEMIKNDLIGGKNSKVKQDMRLLLKGQVEGKLKELTVKQQVLEQNKQSIKKLAAQLEKATSSL